MEFEAGGIPVETDKIDQEPCVMFQPGDHIFVTKVEIVERLNALPVSQDPLVIGQSPRDVVPVIVPCRRPESGLPAGDGDVARISAADDHLRIGEEQSDQAELDDVVGHLVDDAGGRSGCQLVQLVEVTPGRCLD